MVGVRYSKASEISSTNIDQNSNYDCNGRDNDSSTNSSIPGISVMEAIPPMIVNHDNATDALCYNNKNSYEESEDVAVCILRTTVPLRLDRRPPCRPNAFTSVPVLDILFKVPPRPPLPSSISPLPPLAPPVPPRHSSKRRSSFLDPSSAVVSRTKSSSSSQQYGSLYTISEQEEEEVVVVDEVPSNNVAPQLALVPSQTPLL